MNTRIAGYTLATDEFAACVEAYQKFLGYRCTYQGKVPQAMASYWRAAECAQRRCAMLSPAGTDDSFVRIIESAVPARYRPYDSFGWLAAELVVEDVDALAERLHRSPFRALRPPADLSISDQIRAVQVLGPAREVLYLTQIKSRVAGLDTPTARCAVDRPFIMVAGGPSMDAMRSWYRETVGAHDAPTVQAVISAMSACRSLPLDSRYALAALPLSNQCFIELDVMPDGTASRVTVPNTLPPAIAITTLEVSALPATIAAVAAFAEPPYFARRSALLDGAAGEMVELIER